jgi:hypothetical protein
MDVLELLTKRLETMSDEFQFLIKENRKLKAQLESMKNKNDLLTRNSQDMLLTIKSKLKDGNER